MALPRYSKFGDELLLSEEERSCSRHHHYDRVWPMLLKKSAMGRRRATIESRAMTSWIELARSVVVLNQYCSEDPLKILFQQHRSNPVIAVMPAVW